MQTGASGEPKIGRLRAAWLVLMGQRVTPQSIVAEWIEYQQIFNDLLERWSAKLARDAKAEKERIKRLDQAVAAQITAPVQIPNDKTALRRKVARLRGFGLADSNIQPEVTHEPSSPNGDK